jgi:two-component system nitrogen regulation response regulator NtrX
MNDPADRPRVVVIDDDSAFLALMDEVLRDAGYRPSGWRASHGALERLRRQPPAAVILDLWIEDTTAGWRLLEALRADACLRHLPVVVCSADIASLRDRADELAQAAWRAIPKPFDLDDLLGAIAALIPPSMPVSPGGPGRAACPARAVPDAA